MATLAEIVTRVQRRVIDLPSNVSAEVQTLVEEAHRYLQEVHNFKVMEAVASAATTLNTASIGAIGTDLFKDYRGLPWYTDDNGVTYRFRAVTHSEEEVRVYLHTDANVNVGRPDILLHKAPTAVGDSYASHVWEVYPIPDGLANTSDGEYTIKIPYWSYLATPTTSDWFTDNATEYLVNRATAEAFALNWDEARYVFWTQKAGMRQPGQGFTGELARVIGRDKQFRVSNLQTLVPYAGVFEPKLGV